MDYKPIQVEILKKEKFTKDTFLLRLKHKVKDNPGKFLMVGLLGIGECPISICSSQKSYTELLIKKKGKVTQKLSELKKKDKVYVRGPLGSGYPMENLEGNSLVLIGVESGIASLRSVVKYVEKKRTKYKEIEIFLGFKNPERIIFDEDIEKWKKQYKTHMIFDNKDESNFYDIFATDLFKKQSINLNKAFVLICVPPDMIIPTIKKTKILGFKDNRIYLSLERHMKCGLGKCGHCMIKGHHICVDGPVFRYDNISDDL